VVLSSILQHAPPSFFLLLLLRPEPLTALDNLSINFSRKFERVRATEARTQPPTTEVTAAAAATHGAGGGGRPKVNAIWKRNLGRNEFGEKEERIFICGFDLILLQAWE
jgi:hypothetical protein